MTTLKQEIKAVKVGQEKVFEINDGINYLTVRKSKAKGLEIILTDDDENDYEVSYDCIANNFRNFSLYDESEINY